MAISYSKKLILLVKNNFTFVFHRKKVYWILATHALSTAIKTSVKPPWKRQDSSFRRITSPHHWRWNFRVSISETFSQNRSKPNDCLRLQPFWDPPIFRFYSEYSENWHIQTTMTYISRKSRAGARSYRKRDHWRGNCKLEATPTGEKRGDKNPRTER